MIRKDKSKAIFEKAKNYIPGGVNSPVRAFKAVGGDPLFIKSAKGPYLFYKDRIFAVMEHVLNLDETFFYGAPHRYFGAFYAKAPAFAGGDMAKAKEHFDKSLAIDERYLGTKVLYAEYYATKADDKEMFTTLLNDVISADPAIIPEVQPENVVEQEKAKALLAAADDMF